MTTRAADDFPAIRARLIRLGEEKRQSRFGCLCEACTAPTWCGERRQCSRLSGFTACEMCLTVFSCMTSAHCANKA